MDPEKNAALTSWPEPQTVKDLGSFWVLRAIIGALLKTTQR